MAASKLLPRPELTCHPVDVGQRTEAAILSELVRRGYSVLLPFGTNQRYDLVLDFGRQYIRAQCKTGRLRNGTIEFNTSSVQCNMNRALSRTYDGGADVFLVSCPEVDAVYCVPIADAPRSHMYLRLDRTLNKQRNGIRWASDYELPA
jgi:hypothetical protein